MVPGLLALAIISLLLVVIIAGQPDEFTVMRPPIGCGCGWNSSGRSKPPPRRNSPFRREGVRCRRRYDTPECPWEEG
jgi:hypothetical protein